MRESFTLPDQPPPLRVVGEGWGGVKQPRGESNHCCKLKQPALAFPCTQGRGYFQLPHRSGSEQNAHVTAKQATLATIPTKPAREHHMATARTDRTRSSNDLGF